MAAVVSGDQARALKAMTSIPYKGRIEWWVWAARMNTCPDCSRPPGQACLNLTELRRGNHKRTRWPHESRVDWTKMVEGMKKRGYI